jgi:ABC-type transport system involved in multi-copper enzyme maturation permease subunit
MITLLLHYLRRSWLLGAVASVAAFAFNVIGCRVYSQVHESSGASIGSAFAQFMPKWVQSAFNVGPESMTQLNGFLSVCLQHPFLLVVLLALPVTLLTGWISGDVENRSIALVLSRPVGRIHVIATAGLVALLWCTVAVCSAWAGCLVGAHWTGQQGSLSAERLPLVILNLGALMFAIAGIAALISALLSVRGDAVGWCVTIVLIMYVWNFLAQVWYGGGGASNYSLFRFYQPTQILLQGEFQGAHVMILAAIGAAGFLLSAGVFRLRSFSV